MLSLLYLWGRLHNLGGGLDSMCLGCRSLSCPLGFSTSVTNDNWPNMVKDNGEATPLLYLCNYCSIPLLTTRGSRNHLDITCYIARRNLPILGLRGNWWLRGATGMGDITCVIFPVMPMSRMANEEESRLVDWPGSRWMLSYEPVFNSCHRIQCWLQFSKTLFHLVLHRHQTLKYDKIFSFIHSWAFAPTYSLKCRNPVTSQSSGFVDDGPQSPMTAFVTKIMFLSNPVTHVHKFKRMKVIFTVWLCLFLMFPVIWFLWFEVLCCVEQWQAEKKGRKQDKTPVITVISKVQFYLQRRKTQ